MATNFMNLTLPIVTTTLGPEWATELNTVITSIDEHDHTSGKGTKVPTNGLNINSNLTFNDHRATNLDATQYKSLGAALTGAANANAVHVSSGDLYFTNGSGTPVQITSGGALPTTPGAVEAFQFDELSANLVIGPSDTFVVIAVDTTASRSITLPLANGVVAGRIYTIIDKSGDSNNNPITIATAGSDTINGASSITIDSDNAVKTVNGDGVSAWYIS